MESPLCGLRDGAFHASKPTTASTLSPSLPQQASNHITG